MCRYEIFAFMLFHCMIIGRLTCLTVTSNRLPLNVTYLGSSGQSVAATEAINTKSDKSSWQIALFRKQQMKRSRVSITASVHEPENLVLDIDNACTPYSPALHSQSDGKYFLSTFCSSEEWLVILVSWDNDSSNLRLNCKGLETPFTYRIKESGDHITAKIEEGSSKHKMVNSGSAGKAFSCLSFSNSSVVSNNFYSLLTACNSIHSKCSPHCVPGACVGDSGSPLGYSCHGACQEGWFGEHCDKTMAILLKEYKEYNKRLTPRLPAPLAHFPLHRAWGLKDATWRGSSYVEQGSTSKVELSERIYKQTSFTVAFMMKVTRSLGSSSAYGWSSGAAGVLPVFYASSNDMIYLRFNDTVLSLHCPVTSTPSMVAYSVNIQSLDEASIQLYCKNGIYKASTVPTPIKFDSSGASSDVFSQLALPSNRGIPQQVEFSHLLLYLEALQDYQLHSVKRWIDLFSTFFDEVHDNSCRFDFESPTSWLCDGCPSESHSAACFAYTPSFISTSPFCYPECDARNSLCVAEPSIEPYCKCIRRFNGDRCLNIIGEALTNPIDQLEAFSYTNPTRDYESNFYLIKELPKSALQPNNAIRLADGSPDSPTSKLISRAAFPLVHFTFNATFEMEYLPQMSAKLAIVIVSNATSWDFNDTGSSDIFVVFSPGREKIEVRRWPFTDGNVITFRSAAGTVSNLLGSRFHVGVVVRNGRDISMDICTLLACVSPIRDVRLKNAYELHSDADPKVLMIAARSNQGFVDLLDFKVNSLTAESQCDPPCVTLKGRCIENNTCFCKPGFTGQTCAHRMCGDVICSPKAYCESPGKCTCFDRFKTGRDCTQVLCDCENLGRCAGPKLCTCADGSMRRDCRA